MTAEPHSLLDRRLIVITGKGGTGKTAMACTLAEAARRQGLRVLLAETASTESAAALFESNPAPLGYAGRELRPGLHALRIDPHLALAEYVRLQTGLGVVTDRILGSEIFQRLLEGAPGWRELIILGKIWHLEQQETSSGRPAWDLIVVDAPATGHGLTFLDVPRVVQQAVHAGPLARHSSWVEALVHDRTRTLLLPITLPEELPTLETTELVTRARDEIGIAVDRIVVNRMPAESTRRLLDDLAGVDEAGLEFECLPSVPELRALLAHDARRALQAERHRAAVSAACGLPVVDMPALANGFDATSGWSDAAEQILRPPVWPTSPAPATDPAARAQTEVASDAVRTDAAARTGRADSLEHALEHAGVLVCAGTGGVGKTTIAAAIAIQAAATGRRTLVLTIDPARRLADALGLETLASRPTPVQLAGLPDPEGAFARAPLDAMMLDPKPTFDRLITRLTSDDSARERILGNSIYKHLSEALAGSAEYAAMEQVHELVQSQAYDLIVVDTPPSDHALDFLRAPRRLREFLESRFARALVRPAMSASRFGMRFFARPLHRMFGLLERIAGVGFLDDLSEFLSAIDGLSEGFQERATRVEEILLGPQTGFVLVSSAQPGGRTGTLDFLSELENFDVRLVSVIVNRMRPWPLERTPQELLERCQGPVLERDCERLAKALVHAPSAAAVPRVEASTATEGDPGTASSTPGSTAQSAARHVLDAMLGHARVCQAEQRTFESLSAQAARHHVGCLAVLERDREIDHLPGLYEIGQQLRSESVSVPSAAALPADGEPA